MQLHVNLVSVANDFVVLRKQISETSKGDKPTTHCEMAYKRTHCGCADRGNVRLEIVYGEASIVGVPDPVEQRT